MAGLNSIKTPYTLLTYEDKLQMHLDVRKKRLIPLPKKVTTAKKIKASEPRTKKVLTKKQKEKVSKEQLQEMLNLLNSMET